MTALAPYTNHHLARGAAAFDLCKHREGSSGSLYTPCKLREANGPRRARGVAPESGQTVGQCEDRGLRVVAFEGAEREAAAFRDSLSDRRAYPTPAAHSPSSLAEGAQRRAQRKAEAARERGPASCERAGARALAEHCSFSGRVQALRKALPPLDTAAGRRSKHPRNLWPACLPCVGRGLPCSFSRGRGPRLEACERCRRQGDRFCIQLDEDGTLDHHGPDKATVLESWPDREFCDISGSIKVFVPVPKLQEKPDEFAKLVRELSDIVHDVLNDTESWVLPSWKQECSKDDDDGDDHDSEADAVTRATPAWQKYLKQRRTKKAAAATCERRLPQTSGSRIRQYLEKARDNRNAFCARLMAQRNEEEDLDAAFGLEEALLGVKPPSH